MSNAEAVRAKVIEALPDLRFRLQLEDGREVIAYVAGKMKINQIRVIVGDEVSVVLDPYNGRATNRIIRRH